MPLSCQIKAVVSDKKNKIDSLQSYDIPQNYRILHKLVKCLAQHDLKILNHRHIQKLHKKLFT
jgi:hypothetical protein